MNVVGITVLTTFLSRELAIMMNAESEVIGNALFPDFQHDSASL